MIFLDTYNKKENETCILDINFWEIWTEWVFKDIMVFISVYIMSNISFQIKGNCMGDYLDDLANYGIISLAGVYGK